MRSSCVCGDRQSLVLWKAEMAAANDRPNLAVNPLGIARARRMQVGNEEMDALLKRGHRLVLPRWVDCLGD